MWMFIGVLGVLGALVATVVVIVMAFTKNPNQKKMVGFVAVFLIMAVVGFSVEDKPDPYTIEIQRAAFENWNKTFTEMNTQFDSSWVGTQNALDQFSKGNMTAPQIYTSLAVSERIMNDFNKQYTEMVIPKQLRDEHQAILKEAQNAMASASLDRAIVLDKMKAYIDNPKPSLLSEATILTKASSEDLLTAITKVAEVESVLTKQ